MRDIVFIHGMFMNPESWRGWEARFTARGHRCHAVAWPGHEGDPAALRAQPPAVLRTLTLGAVIEAHRAVLATLPAPPIVIGHSVGGLIAQRLLNEGRVAAAVAIDPAPPRGIFTTRWSFFKANLPVVNPFAGNRPFLFDLDAFHFAFCNTLTRDEARAVYDRYVVPEARNVARGPAGADGVIDFRKAHAPLLITAGALDNIVPADLNQKNFAAYTDAGSVRAFKLFAGRDHFLCGNTGWEEVAGFVEGWIDEVLAV